MSSVQWQLDKSHSGINFSVRHMMIASVRGSFNAFEASVSADPANLASAEATITIDASSVDTKDAGRDGHLKSPDFFNVEQFPNITFQTTGIRAKGGEDYEVSGNLTIAGVTQAVKLDAEIAGPAKDPWGNQKIGVTATGSISREAFGLTWNAALETGGFLVGDAIKLSIELQFAVQA
jgi:polyisoprenoid-binding protein YceI